MSGLSARGVWLLAGWLLAGPAPAQEGAPAWAATLDACLMEWAEADPGQPVAWEACPDARRLRDALAEWLEPPLPEDDVTPARLRDLQALGAGLRPPASAAPRMDYAALPDILAASLSVPPEARPGWWERFLDWLGERLGAERKQGGLDWLEDLLRRYSPSQDVVRWVFYASLGLILLLAALIVVNELRALEFSLKRRGAGRPGGLAGAPGAAEQTGGLDALRGLPPARQMAGLLRLGLRHLARTGVLPEQRSLTNRQCLRRLRGHPAEGAFRWLALHAERALYGGHVPDSAECAEGFAQARALLELSPPR